MLLISGKNRVLRSCSKLVMTLLKPEIFRPAIKELCKLPINMLNKLLRYLLIFKFYWISNVLQLLLIKTDSFEIDCRCIAPTTEIKQ